MATLLERAAEVGHLIRLRRYSRGRKGAAGYEVRCTCSQWDSQSAAGMHRGDGLIRRVNGTKAEAMVEANHHARLILSGQECGCTEGHGWGCYMHPDQPKVRR